MKVESGHWYNNLGVEVLGRCQSEEKKENRIKGLLHILVTETKNTLRI